MKTPWSDMIRTAATLGISPAVFWALSLREWRMLTAGPRGPEPMGRETFKRLAEAWPDE